MAGFGVARAFNFSRGGLRGFPSLGGAPPASMPVDHVVNPPVAPDPNNVPVSIPENTPFNGQQPVAAPAPVPNTNTNGLPPQYQLPVNGVLPQLPFSPARIPLKDRRFRRNQLRAMRNQPLFDPAKINEWLISLGRPPLPGLGQPADQPVNIAQPGATNGL